eukprot:PITA_21812
MFLKSMDASNKVKTTEVEEFVQEVGEEHVSQIVTDNAANYMATGILFEIRHPTIFWTYSVVHCIDLMLENIGKLHWIHEVMEKEKSITKYLYNHIIVLNTMRKYTKDAEEIIVVMDSLVRVLRMVDSDKPAMGYIYEAMDSTKEAIKRRYGAEEAKYMALWDIIDAHWDR